MLNKFDHFQAVKVHHLGKSPIDKVRLKWVATEVDPIPVLTSTFHDADDQ